MRRLLRDVAEGDELGDTTTLADPSVVEETTPKIRFHRDSRPLAATESLRNPGRFGRRRPTYCRAIELVQESTVGI